MRVPSLSTSDQDASARLTADELTVLLSRSTASNGIDAFIATRATRTAAFSNATPLAINTAADEYIPSPTDDGQSLVYESVGSAGLQDLFFTTQVSGNYPPGTMLSLSSPDDDQEPFLSADGQVLYYVIEATNGDIYRAVRTGNDFTSSIPVTELNSPAGERQMVVTRDDMTIYFATDRAGNGLTDIYEAHRSAPGLPFSTPVPVVEINSPADEYPTWISVDDCIMYITSNRPQGGSGAYDIWTSTRGN